MYAWNDSKCSEVTTLNTFSVVFFIVKLKSNKGYVKDDHDQTCIDFNECKQGTHSCHAESQVLILYF